MKQTVVGDPFYFFNYDRREMTHEKPNYLDFLVPEYSMLHLYELYYHFLPPYYVKDTLM